MQSLHYRIVFCAGRSTAVLLLALAVVSLLLDLFELSQETSCSECFEKLVQRSGCVDNDICCPC